MIAVGIDPALSLGGLLGGFAVGLTGMGGGALLTPMLVLLFNVPASAAVGTDLVTSLLMKPVSGAVHLRQQTVRLDIVRWLCLGSVPGALAGAVAVNRLSDRVRDDVLLRGIAFTLLLAATMMTVRALRDRRDSSGAGDHRDRAAHVGAENALRPRATLVLGLSGGFLVGLTSVGSGSLMIVILMMLYPAMTVAELVGTDLVQAVPLVGAAAVGHVLLGDVRAGLTLSLLVGALPGAFFGARISSSRTSRVVRPALVVLLVASSARLLTA